jgi:hypothetical protein
VAKLPEPDWSGVRAALAEFDAGQPALDAAWEAADTNEAVRACADAQDAALIKVREAFYEATKDRNNWGQAKLAGLAFIRRCAGG